MCGRKSKISKGEESIFAVMGYLHQRIKWYELCLLLLLLLHRYNLTVCFEHGYRILHLSYKPNQFFVLSDSLLMLRQTVIYPDEKE